MKNLRKSFFLFMLVPGTLLSQGGMLDNIGNLSIKGDKIQLNEKQGVIKIEGNVSLADGDETRFFSDSMTLVQNKTDDLLVLSEGNNRICHGDMRFASVLMNFFPNKNLLVLKQEVRFFFRWMFIESDQLTAKLDNYSVKAVAYDNRLVQIVYVKNPLKNDLGANLFSERCDLKFDPDEQVDEFRLSAKSIEWLPEQRTLSVEGHPQIAERISKASLSADRFDIVFNAENLPIKVNAYGNFVLRQGERDSRSEDAEIDLVGRKVVLVKNVRIKQGENVDIETGKITISLDDSGNIVNFPENRMNLKLRR